LRAALSAIAERRRMPLNRLVAGPAENRAACVPPTRGSRPSLSAAAVLAMAMIFTAAAAVACPPPSRPPQVEVRIDDQQVTYDFSRSRQELAAIAKSIGGEGPRHPYGLTLIQYGQTYKIDTESFPVAGGSCVSLARVEVVLGYARLEVLIDRRYAPDSCERQAALDHEAGHVAIAREALRHYQPAIAAAVRQAAGWEGVLVGSPADANPLLLERIGRAVDPLVEVAQARRREGDARLDSAVSYGETFRRCTGW
jgi:hypothetical protein